MICDQVLRLVEKLADGEATEHERVQAEAHLEDCPDCRAHLEFVTALADASKHVELPEPPEAYWQLLPDKVLSRLERDASDARPSVWQLLLTPSVLRVGAVLATLVVVVAVGVSVWRHGNLNEPSSAPTMESVTSQETDADEPEAATGSLERDVAPPASRQTPATAPTLETDAIGGGAMPTEGPGEPPAPEPSPSDAPAPSAPPVARDESLPLETERDEPARGPLPAELAAVSPAPPPSPPVAETAVEPSSEERAAESRPEPPGPANRMQSLAEDSKLAARAELVADAAEKERPAAGATGEVTSPDRCAAWRGYLARHGNEGSESIEARYRVALCSLERYDRERDDASRQDALRDVDAFLALEDDTERAEEIRRRTEPLR